MWQFTSLFYKSMCSPFATVWGCMGALEIVQGDRHTTKNLYQWETVYFKIPTSRTYSQSMPRVILLR